MWIFFFKNLGCFLITLLKIKFVVWFLLSKGNLSSNFILYLFLRTVGQILRLILWILKTFDFDRFHNFFLERLGVVSSLLCITK
jgi:hypothetical protein